MERHPKVNPPDLARCPHCGNITSHQCAHREDYSVLIEQYDEYNGLWDECWWAILKCTTCGKLSLYQDDWDLDTLPLESQTHGHNRHSAHPPGS